MDNIPGLVKLPMFRRLYVYVFIYFYSALFSRVLKWRSIPFDEPCGHILTPVTVSLGI